MIEEEGGLRNLFAVTAVSVWLSPMAFALPAGEGESLVREHCSSCHRPEILNSTQGYDTANEWRQLMATMVALDEPRADIIARYLARQFQSKPELHPTLIDGRIQIEIEEWMGVIHDRREILGTRRKIVRESQGVPHFMGR